MLFVLGVLVFIHELGHYAVAKWCGVRVEVFSIGFGKRLWGFHRGDTDYRISALPLGGYVKMAGENPMEAKTGDPGEFTSHPRWQRFLIAIAGPVMNIILAIAVLTVVYQFPHQDPAVNHRPADVFFVTKDSPAEKAGIRKGDRIIKIEDIQDPTWSQVYLRFALNPKQLVDVTVRRGDQKLDLKVKPDEVGADKIGDAGIMPPEFVGTIERGTPAEKAGLHEGDAILAVNGTSVQGTEEILNILQKEKSNPVQLTIWREGKELQIKATPQLLPTGPDEKKYRLGFSRMMATEQLPLSQAFYRAVNECKENSGQIFELLGKLIAHKNSPKQMSGPIGIARLAGGAASQGFSQLMIAMAFISLNLAIFNLLPIPILDGGLMLLLLIEGMIRRDVNQQIKERIYQAAFVCLILFASMVIFNDVTKSFH